MIALSVVSFSLKLGDRHLSSKCYFMVLNVSIMSSYLPYRLKHYSPLHKQEKKVFVFPDTPTNDFLKGIPYDMKTTQTLSSFKVRFSRRDFRRCTDDIMRRGSNENNDGFPTCFETLEPRGQNVQIELTTMALSYLETMSLSGKTEQKGRFGQSNHGKLAIDVGCGKGICMDPLVERGYTCIGVDLDLHSLLIFKNNGNRVSWINSMSTRKTIGKSISLKTPPSDIVRWDLRHGLPFRDSTCDVIISISFLQWLFYGKADQQLDLFFFSLYKALCFNGAAVVQFYPRSQKQFSDAVSHAMHYFKGAVIADYPHMNRGRKYFLLLFKV